MDLKKTVGKLTNNRAYGHYREMAWLPFQKQNGTFYSGDLNTELVRYSNGSKLFDHRMVPYSDHHLNIELKVRYSDHGLNSEQKVWYSNGRNLSCNLSLSLDCFMYINNFNFYKKWSRLVTVRYSNGGLNTEPFEYRTSKSS